MIAFTPGTLANRNFDELIRPNLLALSDMEVAVVAVIGRADADLGLVPKNACVADFIPFDRLMPRSATRRRPIFGAASVPCCWCRTRSTRSRALHSKLL